MLKRLKEHIEQIIKLDEKEYESIIPFFKTEKLRKRQFVIQENQPVLNVYFVSKGLLKSGFIDNIGKEHIMQFACNNWWISDFTAFFKQENSTLAIECIEDSELLSISYGNLNNLCAAFPKMEHFFRVKSNFGYIALQQRLLSMMKDSAKDRYEIFCTQYPTIIDRVPKQLIANYLGVSRETLSRLYLSK